MKLFKNFQTKKQLRKEIKRLNNILSKPPQIYTVEIDIQKIQSSFSVPEYKNVPIDIIKSEIAKDIAEYIKPIIELDFENDGYGNKIYTGSLYVSNKK